MRLIAATLSGCLALGCGGLDNRPLTEGTLRGRLTSHDVARAVVAVLGHPELNATPDANGAFAIEHVPQGKVELLAVGSQTTALRLEVTVPPGDVVELGAVRPLPAATVHLGLRPGAYQRVDGARVDVLGTPLLGFKPDGLGEVEVSPLPVGCYQLRAEVPGFGRFDQAVCVPDEREMDVDIDLPETDGSPGHEGCLVAGCEDTYVCQTDGRCESP